MRKEKEPRDPLRRKFIKHGVATAGAAVLGLAGYSLLRKTAHATAETTVNPSARIDVHGHIPNGTLPPDSWFYSSFAADNVISLMDKAGIARMVIMPSGMRKIGNQWQPLDNLNLTMCNKYPNRIIPFLSTMYPAWNNPPQETVLSFADSQLASGLFKGVGELMVRYYVPPGRTNEPEVNIPADSPFMKRLSDIVVKYDVPMSAHMVAEPDSVQSLENLLNYNPKLKFIWAHMGFWISKPHNPPNDTPIGEMMDSYPNLYTDISALQAKDGRWPPGTSLTDKNGVLYPKFKKILQDHSDRVMFGLDTPYLENWAESHFVNWTSWADSVVAQLGDQEIVEGIMHKNVEKLLKLTT